MFQMFEEIYFPDKADTLFEPSITFVPALYASRQVEAVILGHRSEYHFSLSFWPLVPFTSIKESGVKLDIKSETCCSSTDVSSRL